MADKQVSLANSGTVAVSGASREVEKESTEETTLSEMTKDLGHTKIHEKSASFQSQATSLVKEENKTQQSESNKSVVQKVSQEVSSNRQVTTSSFSSSQSFSMEETEEYVIEG